VGVITLRYPRYGEIENLLGKQNLISTATGVSNSSFFSILLLVASRYSAPSKVLPLSGETKVVFVGIPVLVNVTVSVFVEVGVIIVRYVAGIHPILPSESSTSTQMSL
jgi:hypothetical protein